MSFMDIEDTRILYIHARPRRGCDVEVVGTLGKMVDLCRDMYEGKSKLNVQTELGSRKKLTILFLFENVKDKQAFEQSDRYQELFTDLEAFCKKGKLYTATEVQASIAKDPRIKNYPGSKFVVTKGIFRSR